MSEIYLYILLFLHTYWFYLFMKMLQKVFVEKEVVDLQNDELKEVEADKRKKKAKGEWRKER